jgi:hypothetical protein
MRSVVLCLALCAASSANAHPSSITKGTTGGTSLPAGISIQDEGLSVGDAVAQSVADAARSRSSGGRAALTKADLCRTAATEATANNLPAHFFFANLIQQESGFRPDVVSPAGAQGIAQFMPPVAFSYGLADPFEPIAALKASANLLADLVEQFGNLGLAAAAYNAGPKRVQDWMDKRRNLPAETRHYVYKITGRPAEHWANPRIETSKVLFPIHADCPDLSIMAMSPNQIKSADATPKMSAASKRDAKFANVSQHQPGPKLSVLIPSSKRQSGQVTGGSTRQVAENFKRQRSARAHSTVPGLPPVRFVATPTPIIMADEKVQSRLHVGREKKRLEGSLPRPSEFTVGARVPAAIRASESAVLSRKKTSVSWVKEMKNRAHVVDADSGLRSPSIKPHRKT